MKRLFFALICLLFLGVGVVAAQETIEDSGKEFPTQITVTHDTLSYDLTATGITLRKKFIVKVYAVVHYMQDPPTDIEKDEAHKLVLSDSKAKQITMDFFRDVGADKIQGAYQEGFKKNATETEFKAIQSQVDQFVSYFGEDVKENETYILRWLPGGTVLTTVKGEEMAPITGETFARVLWSIWLGDDSIVDRDNLVKGMTE